MTTLKSHYHNFLNNLSLLFIVQLARELTHQNTNLLLIYEEIFRSILKWAKM